MIISVSRRCDIPRFRFGWFLERINEGFVDTVNPFNARQIRRIYFSGGETVHSSRTPGAEPDPSRLEPDPSRALEPDPSFFVFWTRDPRRVLEHSPELMRRGFRFYTMVSLLNYPAILEPNPPPYREVAAAMKALTRTGSPQEAGFGRTEAVWRYDPVLLSTLTGPEYHRRNFAGLAAALEGAVNRVIISVYDDYAGSRRRLAALAYDAAREAELSGKRADGVPFAPLPHYDDGGRILPELRQLLAELAAIARRHGIVPQSCAEAEDLSELGIGPGACIDPSLIETVCSGGPMPAGLSGKDKNQRPHCLCAKSVDIGNYGDCPAACAYCYARRQS
jgi:hypothetical protein